MNAASKCSEWPNNGDTERRVQPGGDGEGPRDGAHPGEGDVPEHLHVHGAQTAPEALSVNPASGDASPDQGHDLAVGGGGGDAEEGAAHHHQGGGHHHNEAQGGGHGGDLGAHGLDDSLTEHEETHTDTEPAPGHQ